MTDAVENPVDNPVDTGAAPVDNTPAPVDNGGQVPAAASPAPQEVSNPFASLPENWRSSLVESAGIQGDDAGKVLSQLERVSDMGTLVKNYISAQDRIRRGELSNGLPENATEQQLADWREANGVPQAADQYQVELGDGLVLGEEDQRIMPAVYDVALKHNVSNQAMSEMVNAFMAQREIEVETMHQQHGIHNQQATQVLKETWGGDFQANLNMVKGLVNQLPDSVRDAFESAVMPDGRAVFNSPEVMVFFADLARQVNPAGTVVPNANNPVQAINDEIANLESRMGTDEWYADTAAQQRYQQLVTARENMNR